MEAEPQERVAQLERPEGTNPPDDRRLDNSYRLDIKSIESLWPGEWLDDGVINAFLRSLCLTRPGEYVTFDGAALNFLLSVLESEGATAPTQTEVDELYKPFRALAATVTGNRGLVFMPFCLGSHWILAVADLQTQIIRVYDSLVSWDRTSQVVPSRLVEQILPYVKGTLRFCSDEDGWAVEHIRLPIETNSTECGVYLCLMALHETHRPETGLGGYVTLFYDENGVLSSYKLDSCYWIAGRKVILEVCRRLFIPTSVTIESIDGLGSTQYLPRNEYIQRRAQKASSMSGTVSSARILVLNFDANWSK
ncbi:putative smt3-specific protease [Diaporthe ampelina]|uniref:Putative smt3-specific protease n=1 Tax=Diaporthe ampelina TaxID=1214573 RepID=A0A0G2FIP3_9PEZI|nr:putative smt3-specific protease [Diaporthe ampelina]